MTIPGLVSTNIFMKSKCIRQSNKDTFIEIEVIPNSTRSGIQGYNYWRERIVINLYSPAHKGKANNELIKILSTILSVNQKQLIIVKGPYSKLKTIRIVGLSFEEVIERLFGVLNEKPRIK